MNPNTGTGFPSRNELIAWGLEPCQTPDCRVLVNPEVAPHCIRCKRRHGR